MTDNAPEPRVGDTERREVDEQLQEAMGDGRLTLAEYEERSAACWAARTRSDLDPLLADLPRRAAPPVPLTKRAPAKPAKPDEDDEDDDEKEEKPGALQRIGSGIVSLVVAGAAVFLGAQVLTADDGSAVFSTREIQVSGEDARVEVGALFGTLEVRVPDDVRVRIEGPPQIFASVECGEACRGGEREVVVEVRAGFASVDILRQAEPPPAEPGD